MFGYYLFLIVAILFPIALCVVGVLLRKKPIGIKLYRIGIPFLCAELLFLLDKARPWIYEHFFVNNPTFLFLLLVLLLYISYRICYIFFPEKVSKPKSVRQKEEARLEAITLALRAIYSTCDILFSYHDVLYYAKVNLATCNGSDPIKYTRQDGLTFSAYPSEPLLFAYICLAQYATDDERDNLRSFCDSHIVEASRSHLSLF